MFSLLYLLVLVSLMAAVQAQLSTKNIRIVEGVDKMSAKEDDGLDDVQPDVFYGPESLSFMNGLCFSKSIDRFEYNVCPFQNVTQRRITGQYATILGVWGKWDEKKLSQDSHMKEYTVQKYLEGKSCGENKVDTTLIFECGHDGDFEILSADDNVFCTYILKLGVPMACSLFRK